MTGYVTGTFDPVTEGHLYLVKKSKEFFDKTVVLVLVNPEKTAMFSLSERLTFLEKVLADENVEIAFFDGLAVDFVNSRGTGMFVRGVRNDADRVYEEAMSKHNSETGGVGTIIFEAPKDLQGLSSTVVKENLLKGVFEGVPEKIVNDIKEALKDKI